LVERVRHDSCLGLPSAFMGKKRSRFALKPLFDSDKMKEQWGSLFGVVEPISEGTKYFNLGQEEVVSTKCSYPGCCVCVGQAGGPEVQVCSRYCL
jgi:hypothetical protein